jgi:hypothetical protein
VIIIVKIRKNVDYVLDKKRLYSCTYCENLCCTKCVINIKNNKIKHPPSLKSIKILFNEIKILPEDIEDIVISYIGCNGLCVFNENEQPPINCRNYKKTNKSYCTKHIENKDFLNLKNL